MKKHVQFTESIFKNECKSTSKRDALDHRLKLLFASWSAVIKYKSIQIRYFQSIKYPILDFIRSVLYTQKWTEFCYGICFLALIAFFMDDVQRTLAE